MEANERIIIVLCAVLLVSLFDAPIGGTVESAEVVFTDSGQNLGGGVSFAVAPGDVDGDGDLDAVVSAYQAEDGVWLNDGAGSFTSAGVLLGSQCGVSLALGDVDGDSDPDAIAGFTTEYACDGITRLYLNETEISVEETDWGKDQANVRRLITCFSWRSRPRRADRHKGKKMRSPVARPGFARAITVE